VTYDHKFDEKWHLAFESWYIDQKGAPNSGSNGFPAGVGPFDPGQPDFIRTNAPSKAVCPPRELFCTANEWSALLYLNYRYTDLDNFTFRTEYFSDEKGQRTGVKADYDNFALGWQHWFSPSVYIRPEIAAYNTTNGVKSFGRDAAGTPHQSSIVVFSVDTIIHF